MRNASEPKILIIDDSSTTRFYMASALQKAGYHVMAAADGAEGFSLVLHEPPDCLIVDIVLPGMGGFEICRRLRARAPLRNLPIIMVSTKNTPIDQAWGLRQGANRYLPKPFSEEELVNTVKELLSTYKAPSVSPPVQNPGISPRPAPQKAGTGPRPVVQNMGTNPQPAAQNMGTNPQPVPQNTKGTAPRLSSIRPAWFKLIPRRREDDNMIWVNDPQSIVLRDMQMRYFYAAIDGQRNLEQLGMIMRMNAEDILKAVRILLAHHHILLYDSNGKLVDHASLLAERS